MKIDFANLQLQYQKYKSDIDASIQTVLNKSNYIMGEEVKQLEAELSKFTGTKHAITCSSGTDALLLALMAMDIQPSDEIITTPFTFVSTAETIASMKAKPVFVDIESDTFNIDANLIEAAITDKTKAIIPVSLFGQPADMDAIKAIADKYNLKVIIDGAQSFGATQNGKKSCNLSTIGCTSFFPSKPLGCYGDGGAIFTNSDELADKIKSIRVHGGGSDKYENIRVGLNGRMDTIQAAVLLEKFSIFPDEVVRRNKVAEYYSSNLPEGCRSPIVPENYSSSWGMKVPIPTPSLLDLLKTEVW